MRYALLLATVAALLAAAPAALAGNGGGAGADDGPAGKGLPPLGAPVTTIVSGPARIDPSQVSAAGGGVEPAGVAPAAVAAGDCGACIVECWRATTRSGPSDWSGHAYIYQHVTWCGNGAVVTYGAASQTYEQAGWYTLGGEYGPWWSGGCIGCAKLSVSGYILWNWNASLINIHHSGTSWLTTTLYAYGGITV